MNYYLGMTRALALSLGWTMCACSFSPPGPWGFTAKMDIPAFVLDDTHSSEAFAIEANYTAEAFPKSESGGAAVDVRTRVSPASGQKGTASIEPLDPSFAGEQGLHQSGPIWEYLDADVPEVFIVGCRDEGACSLQLLLTFSLAAGETPTAVESMVSAGVGGEREGDEPDGAQVCLLVSRVNGDARTSVAEEECVPSGCRAVQPLTLGLVLSSIPLLLRRRR